MILYLDASALVKRYVAEPGSAEVNAIIAQAEVVGTAVVSRAEGAAALARAVRTGALTQVDAMACLQAFRNEWPDLARVQITELVIARADTFAWDYGLRGYDAVHLAAATHSLSSKPKTAAESLFFCSFAMSVVHSFCAWCG
jgi:predicted nucleic acid-binding protein